GLHDLHVPRGPAAAELRRAACDVVSQDITTDQTPLLAVDDLTVAYGAVTAVRGVSLTVADGEIVAALGPNGAGKTTLLRTIAGALKPRGGSVRFDGAPITGLSPEAVL